MSDRWATEELARFALEADPGPAPRSAARRCILDALGSAAAGWTTPAARAFQGFAADGLAPGGQPVWFTGRCLSPAAAAAANAVAASALDLDDGHREAAGHPGAAVVPTVLAAGSGAGGPDLLHAVAVGYEVGVRVAAARNPDTLDTYSTGRWAAYAVVAAAGRLWRVPPDLLAHALAVAGVLSPGLSAAGYSRFMGNSAKEGIPWAVLTGFAALDLARRGWTGPLDILDHPGYFDPDRVLRDLGRGPYAVEQTYFKPYGCCRWIHAALDALQDIAVAHRVRPGEIERIDVDTFGRALSLSNEPAPTTLEGAQYSVPFCLAAAAVRGPAALVPPTPDLLADPRIRDLARRVRLVAAPDLDPLFPARTPARVTVHTRRGTWTRQVDVPRGDPDNPLSEAEIEAKFHTLCGRAGLASERAQTILAAVRRMEQDGPAPLLEALGPPPTEG